MSLLTIHKLNDSVGAEVAGLDPAQLASDDSLGEAILDALEDNGVLVFRDLRLDPEAQVAFCRRLGEVDHSSDGHHPVAGIYPITLDPSKNSSAADRLRMRSSRLLMASSPCRNQNMSCRPSPGGRSACARTAAADFRSGIGGGKRGLLARLPERRQRPQLFHNARHHRQDMIDVFIGVVA